MKTLADFRSFKFKPTRYDMPGLSDLMDFYHWDFDVYLSSRGFNLQRDFCWTLGQKQELVMSVFYQRPIPGLSLVRSYNSNKETTMEVIDGKQRLSALLDFWNNKFQIRIDGDLYYRYGLHEALQRAIHDFSFSAQVISSHNGSFTDQDKIDWFLRLNFAGTEQDKMHLERIQTRI
jgi:hypothetical protein